jgi:hypothetical protein
MGKKILFCTLIVASAIVVNLLSSNKEKKSYNEIFTEALADGEPSTIDLTCYCALLTDSSCAVNNHSFYACAGGVNVMCANYNSNCN